MKKYIPRFGFRYTRNTIALVGLYFVGIQIASFLLPWNFPQNLVWPGAGLGLAILILYGYNLWVGILIGSTMAYMALGYDLITAFGIAGGQSLAAVVGTYLLRYNVTLYRMFERLSDTLAFIVLASLVSTIINASFTTFFLIIGDKIPLIFLSDTWLSLWIASTQSVLITTPFLLTWLRPTRPWNANKLGLNEIVLFCVVVLLSSLAIFWHVFSQFKNIPIFYLISIPLLWAGLRFGSRGLTGTIFFISTIAMVGTIRGYGPFFTGSLSQSVLYLEIFLSSIAVTFIIFLSIVKERRHATRDLLQHVGKLEDAVNAISSADKAKNDFLAILAHELRNPLAPVKSSIELLKIQSSDQKVLNLASTMETHIGNMARLLDDLLDVSRISREKFILEKEIVDLIPIVHHSVDTVRHLIEENSHTLRIDLPRDPVWLHADPLRLEQMIVNLLTNAAKYTEHGGRIHLAINQETNMVHIHVKDSGIGIPESMLPYIFDPFLQVPNRESSKGLGIGLSLTKKFAELHQGTLTARSEGLGLGSEFIISLPLPENVEFLESPTEKTKILEEKLAPVETTSSPKKRILVVDDNEAAATGLAALLSHLGHKVETVFSGEAAVQKNIDHRFEIVLLDIGLPGMDGYEAARKIREIGNPLLLVALSGYGQEEDKMKAFEAGFDAHLTKPVSIADVSAVINGMN